MLNKLIRWWQKRKIMKAVDASNRRMNNMSREERQRLSERAREIMYPDGYWTCDNHGLAKFNWPQGKPCLICEENKKAVDIL